METAVQPLCPAAGLGSGSRAPPPAAASLRPQPKDALPLFRYGPAGFRPCEWVSASMPWVSSKSTHQMHCGFFAWHHRVSAAAWPKNRRMLLPESFDPPRQQNPPLRPEAPQPGVSASSSATETPASARCSAADMPGEAAADDGNISVSITLQHRPNPVPRWSRPTSSCCAGRDRRRNRSRSAASGPRRFHLIALLLAPPARLVTSEAVITPTVTMAIMIVDSALISG